MTAKTDERKVIVTSSIGNKKERYIKVPESYIISQIQYHDLIVNDSELVGMRPTKHREAIVRRNTFIEIYQSFRKDRVKATLLDNLSTRLTRWKKRKNPPYGRKTPTISLKPINLEEIDNESIQQSGSRVSKTPEEVKLFLEGVRSLIFWKNP